MKRSLDMRTYVDEEASTDTGETSSAASDDDSASQCSNHDLLSYDYHPEDIYDALITHTFNLMREDGT